MGGFLCLCLLGTNFGELFDPVICCVVITCVFLGLVSCVTHELPGLSLEELFNKLISGNLPFDWKQKRKK